MILSVDRTYLPSFGITDDQAPVCIYTVLCLGSSGRDCAAYRGIGPDLPRTPEDEPALLNRIREGGNKIHETEARKMFDLSLDGVELQYRR